MHPTMFVINVRGVEINFPYKPYECQVQYMEKVIECLQEGKNGILESPTGTGKTLCLLCATLAWRETYMAHLQLNLKVQENKASGQFCDVLQENLGQAAVRWNSEENNAPDYDVPKIIYTSRTHSQLTQAVNELKNTIYKPKVCVLGSREQLCINPQVLEQETNTAKVHLCRAKVETKKCHFYNNLEQENTSNNELSEILDIEDLVGFGKSQSVCPYYMSRNQKKAADIIFMPYNYLIDAKSRSANGIDISKSIILFDEAHNIERICEESKSFDLTSFDIASCIEDLDKSLDILSNLEEDGTLSLVDDAGNPSDGGLDKKEIAYMKGLLLMLEDELNNIITSSSEGITKPGRYIYELLRNVKITHETQEQVLELIEKVCTFLVTNQEGGLKPKQFLLSKFADALKIVFQSSDLKESDNQDTSEYYKVHIQQKENDSSKKRQLDVWSTSKATSSKIGYSLGYWCFSPGETMKDLIKNNVRSMILTSGTLSPLQSFKAELQINIPVELQNPHVIKKHQMFVGVLKAGPDAVVLNSSFKNRNNEKYLTSLGNAIVNFAQVVPDGMLVFFPSYGTLDTALKHWQAVGLWSRLESRKAIFVEPKRKSEFREAMEGFYEKVRNPDYKGAVFLAVCRGKVSEGVDFSDINGRAVIITGLPYPPAFDARVKLKQQFLDEMKNKRTFKGLTGYEWYRQQASRAVNQAVGRVLRHKEDFGAILFCDERFTFASNTAELPKWMKPYINNFSNFGELQKRLRQFFGRATELCDLRCMKVRKLTKDEIISATNDVESEKEDHWLPQAAIQDSKNNSKPKSFKHEIAKKRIDRRQEKLPRTPVMIQYEVLPNCETENRDKNCTTSTHIKQNCFFDSLQAYEVKKQKNIGQEELKQTSSKYSAYSPVVEETKPIAVKKKLKIVRPKYQPDKVEGEKPSNSSIKAEAIRAYLKKALKLLGDEKYKEVTNAIKEFKKDNDFEPLLLCMITVLLAKEEYYDLYLGFTNNLPESKRKIYLQKYTDITGQEIPEEYEKRKRNDKTEGIAPNKKIRTAS